MVVLASPSPNLGLTRASIMSFFDARLFDAGSIDGLLREAAQYAGCVVGWSPDGESGRTCTPDSVFTDCPVPRLREGVVPRNGAVAWAIGVPSELADFFAERLVVTASVVEAKQTFSRAQVPPLLEVARAWPGQDVRHIIERLGLSSATIIQFAVCSGEPSKVEEFTAKIAQARDVIARESIEERVILLLAAPFDAPIVIRDVPQGIRAAYSRRFLAQDIREAYQNAQNALRFALPSPQDRGPYMFTSGTWVNADVMGGFEVLCLLSRDQINIVPDVHAIDTLVEKHGEQILRVLEAYAATESLRKAGTIVHMHHNTVAYWVQRAESVLGYPLNGPYRRTRLFVALCLYRVRSSLTGLPLTS